MDLKLHFTEGRWKTIQQDWLAWWAGELERPLVVLECIEAKDASTAHYASTFLGNFGIDASADELLELFIPRLEATYYLGDAYPRFWPNFGPGIVAAFVGANLHAMEDTTWFSPGKKDELAELQIKLYEGNSWWRQVKAVTQKAVERWGEQLSVGITDLGGNLDILAHLRGTEQLLFDLLDAPKEVQRLVKETTSIWLECYEQLYDISRKSRGISCWGPCWSPRRGYLLQSDFAYMISPQMFERFVLPDLSNCCEHMEYAFYHLDGKGQLGHLDMLLGIQRLRRIQWVPGDGQPQAECWIPLIKRILQSGKLCQVYAGAQAALSILREVQEKGLLVVINETLNPEEGAGLMDEIHWLTG
jgi:5-methyltetrahydrofolate--homocysteine methyltransferase